MGIERKYKVEIGAGVTTAVIGGVAIYFVNRALNKGKKEIEPDLTILNERRVDTKKLQLINYLAAHVLTSPKSTLQAAMSKLDAGKSELSGALGFLKSRGLVMQEFEGVEGGGSITYLTPTLPLVEAAADPDSYPFLATGIEVLLEQIPPAAE